MHRGRRVAAEHHSIETVVRTHLHAVALHDASTTEKERLQFATRRFALTVEERVDALRDVFRLRPCRTIVFRIPARHSNRRLTRRSCKAHLSRCTEHNHFVTFAIGHNGSVTITCIATLVGVHAVIFADTFCHRLLACVTKHVGSRPSSAVISRTREEEVDTAGTDVAHSRVARVCYGQYRAVLCRGDSRNSISHLRLIVIHEDILLRFGFRDLARHHHIEIRQESRIVIAVQRKFCSRHVIVVSHPLHVMSIVGRGETFILDFHRNMLIGNGTLCVEFKFSDRITRTGRHDIVTGLHFTHVSQNAFARSLHIVSHGRECQLRILLLRCPSIFVTARTL